MAKAKAKSSSRKQAKIVAQHSPEAIPVYYTNNTEIATSFWDVGMQLAVTIGVDKENNTAIVRPLAYVRMSHQHARVVADFLTQQLDEFEKHHGPIPSRQNDG